MNDLAERFGARLVVLAFPCNQFGHQENGGGDEIRNGLKFVRPGNGFEPKAILMEKVQVNGANAHPVFAYLRSTLPTPSDDTVSLIGDPACIIWKPVTRTDISWNFEKFLIGPDGKPVKRYSKSFLTKDIAEDIQALL